MEEPTFKYEYKMAPVITLETYNREKEIVELHLLRKDLPEKKKRFIIF